MSALLSLESVTAGYATDTDILRQVTIHVESAGITGLIGLNGAGKSTIMKAIYGLVMPRAGRVLYAGEDITGAPPHSMIDRGVWYIPQESSLFPLMRVSDNILLPLQHLSRRGVIKGDEKSARVDEALEKFPVLREKWKTQAGDLSGGQQKLVEFVKAYVVRPRLCIMDEPSTGLSPKIAEEVYGWIRSFVESGMTVFLVDHNIRRVVRIAGRIYALRLGEITAAGCAADFDLNDNVKVWLGIDS